MVCLVVCSMICCVPRGQTNHPAPNPRSRQTSPVITTTAHVGWAVSLARVARIPSMVLVSVRNSFRRRAVSLRSAFSVAAAVVTASLASSSATTATAMTGSGDVSESNISPPILLPLLVWRDPHPQTRPARVFAIFDGLEDLVDLLLQAATGFASREAFPGWRPRWFNVDPVLASFDQERLGSDIRGRRAAFAERRIARLHLDRHLAWQNRAGHPSLSLCGVTVWQRFRHISRSRACELRNEPGAPSGPPLAARSVDSDTTHARRPEDVARHDPKAPYPCAAMPRLP